MKSRGFAGVFLIAAGLLIMVYGGVKYSRSIKSVDVDDVKLSVRERKSVYVPFWLGAVTVLSGGCVLLVNRKKM